VSDSLWPHGLQHIRPPCPSPSLRVCLGSCLLNWWCHPTISFSVALFSFCLQSLPASGLFQWVSCLHPSSWITALSWGRGLCNSMKLWDTEDGQVIVKRSHKTWPTGGGNGKPLQYSCCENPMNCIKRQNNNNAMLCYVTSVVSDSVWPQRWQPTRLPHPWDSPGKNTGVGCHFLLQCMKVKRESEVAQSCQTLRDPMDCSPPGSSVHGIFQARVLEWGA